MKQISVQIGVDVRQIYSCPMEVPDDWPDNITDDFIRALDMDQQLDFWEKFYDKEGYLVDEERRDKWVMS